MKQHVEPRAAVIRESILHKQICVPEDWTDEQAQTFAGPSGTTAGWIMLKDGDEDLNGYPARRPCAEREGFVHIAFNC